MPDYHLIARVQAAAGRHVHRLANVVTIYLVTCEEGSPEALAIAADAERRMRIFLRTGRLDPPGSPPAPPPGSRR